MDVNKMLLEMERLRRKHEHGKGHEDWVIRVCQAIVAKEAGFDGGRNSWSPAICAQLNAEKEGDD